MRSIIPFVCDYGKVVFSAEDVVAMRLSGAMVTIYTRSGEKWDLNYPNRELADAALEQAMKFMIGAP